MSQYPPNVVCHISTVHSSFDVRIYHRECRSLAAAGFRVYLVIPSDKAHDADGVTIVPIWRVRHRFIRMVVMPWIAMVKALRTGADLFHYHDPELLPMAFVLSRLFRKKVVYDIHESVPRQLMSKPYLPVFSRRIVSLCYKGAERILSAGQSLVIANSNCIKDYPTHSHLVQNYPSLDQQSASVSNRPMTKVNPPLIVYLGGVSEIRGSLIYVQLAYELARKGREFKMLIIGPYSPGEGAKLRAKVDALGVQDHLEITGRMSWPEALKRISHASIGLCLLLPVPNYVTCLATKILEYMMLGVPVLASRFEVWRPYVEGERTGLMADPTNMNEIVEACERMLGNEEELKLMGQRGMKAIDEKYNWSIEFKRLLECYRDLLHSNSNG